MYIPISCSKNKKIHVYLKYVPMIVEKGKEHVEISTIIKHECQKRKINKSLMQN